MSRPDDERGLSRPTRHLWIFTLAILAILWVVGELWRSGELWTLVELWRNWR